MSDERGGRYFREARFFLAGDRIVAQSHILEARSLMGYMRDMHAMGGPPIQVQYVDLPDGSTIKATMMNGQYVAQIFSPGGEVVTISQDYWPIVVHSAVDNLKRVAKFLEGCALDVKPELDPVYGRRYWYGHGTVLFATAVNVTDVSDLWMRKGSAPAELVGSSAVIEDIAGFTEYQGQVFVVKVSSVTTQPEYPTDLRYQTTYTYTLHTLTNLALTLVHTCAAVVMPLGGGTAQDVTVTFNETGNVGLAVGNLRVATSTVDQQLLQITISGDSVSGFTYADTRPTSLGGYELGMVTVPSRIAVGAPDYHTCNRSAHVVGFRGDTPAMLVRELFAETGYTVPTTYTYQRVDTRIVEVVGGVETQVLSNSSQTYGWSMSIGYTERVYDYMYVMAADLRVGAYTYIQPTSVSFGALVSSPFPPYFTSTAYISEVTVFYRRAEVEHAVYTIAITPADIAFDKYPLEYTPYTDPAYMAISRILSVPHTYADGHIEIHPSALVFSPHNVGSPPYNYFSNTSAIKHLCAAGMTDVTEVLANGTGDANTTRYNNFGIR